jgi:hypothetical protein
MTAPSDRRRGRRPKIWKDLLQADEQPPMDPTIDEHLQEYVTKRKQELSCSWSVVTTVEDLRPPPALALWPSMH